MGYLNSSLFPFGKKERPKIIDLPFPQQAPSLFPHSALRPQAVSSPLLQVSWARADDGDVCHLERLRSRKLRSSV